jgi:hypothetical protein
VLHFASVIIRVVTKWMASSLFNVLNSFSKLDSFFQLMHEMPVVQQQPMYTAPMSMPYLPATRYRFD